METQLTKSPPSYPNDATRIVCNYMERGNNPEITLDIFRHHLHVLLTNATQCDCASTRQFVGTCVKFILDETDWDYVKDEIDYKRQRTNQED